jgi:hypothetical protein
MKTTFTKSLSTRQTMTNRLMTFAVELLIIFLIVFGTVNVFAQTTTKSEQGKLDLVKQTVVFNSGKVYLNWVTKANSADCVYVIERSVDGDEYEPVGLKEGIGSPIELLYSWIDNQPKEGTSYYRIKEVNMEGKLVAKSDQMDMSTPQNPLFIDRGSRMVQAK